MIVPADSAPRGKPSKPSGEANLVGADPPIEAPYSIAAVSKLTGVSCHTLRVWERRYGFPVPLRTPSGHRRYSTRQVDLICEVARRIRDGDPLARLAVEAREGRLEVTPRAAPGPIGDEAVATLIDVLGRADFEAAESAYRRSSAGLSPAEVATRIITPALTESGERLFRRDCSVSQERLTSAYLLRKLATLLDEAQRANSRPIANVLAVVLQGDRHEGGAMLLSLALELGGWRAIYLGADLAVREVQRAIQLWRPAAVGVSMNLSRNVRKRFGELAGLEGAPIFVGGRSVVNYQGLARRSGLTVVLGPAIPNAEHFLSDLRPAALPEEDRPEPPPFARQARGNGAP